MSPEDRKRRARIAALRRWGRTPPEERAAATRAAREAFDARWYELADPDGVLPERERHLMAERLRRAHFESMWAKAVAARRANKVA